MELPSVGRSFRWWKFELHLLIWQTFGHAARRGSSEFKLQPLSSDTTSSPPFFAPGPSIVVPSPKMYRCSATLPFNCVWECESKHLEVCVNHRRR